MKAFWSTLHRPYKVVDAWIMAHHPHLWAERYHLGLGLALILSLLSGATGLLFWSISWEIDRFTVPLLFLAGLLLLYWIWQRSRLYGCLPPNRAWSGWWFSLLDLTVCACIAFAPLLHWKAMGLMVRIAYPDIQQVVEEGQRIQLAWTLWESIAKSYCDELGKNLLQTREAENRFIDDSPHSYKDHNEEPKIPPGTVPPALGQSDDWSVRDVDFVLVGDYGFDLEKRSHALAAYRLLDIPMMDDTQAMRSVNTINKLADFLQVHFDQHNGPALPRDWDPEPNMANAERLCDAKFHDKWAALNTHFRNYSKALAAQGQDDDVPAIGFIITVGLLCILITTFAIGAVGVGAYWLGWAGTVAIFLSGIIVTVTNVTEGDVVFIIGGIVLCLMLLVVIAHAVFQVVGKHIWVKFLSTQLCTLIPPFALLVWDHSENLPTPLILMIALVFYNILFRAIFTCMRAIPDPE